MAILQLFFSFVYILYASLTLNAFFLVILTTLLIFYENSAAQVSEKMGYVLQY